MTTHPLFTVHTLCHLTCSPTYWTSSKYCILSKRSDPYIKTFSTLSEVRMVFWILPQLDILCTSAVIQYCAKNSNSPFKRHLFPMHCSSWKQEKTCHRVDQTSVWSIPYSGKLCNKNCIVHTSDTLIVWSAPCYTAGSDKWDAMSATPTAKKSGDGV